MTINKEKLRALMAEYISTERIIKRMVKEGISYYQCLTKRRKEKELSVDIFDR